MKAKAYQLPALKRDIQTTYKGALVFGPDFGVVQETAEMIGKMIVPDLKDDFCVVRITPAKIKEKKSVVLDEANAMSLMGGRRMVWIKEADNNCADVISEVLAQIKTDTFILMTADNLTKSSALRVEAENHPKFLTIACYADEERDIQMTIQSILKQNGYTVTSNALILLKDRLTENRIATRRELEKLMTYAGEKKTIDEEDVLKTSTVSLTSSFDALTMAVANGHQKAADTAYQTLLSNGETPVAILRVLMTYFNKLLLGSAALSKGDSLEIAAKKVLKPAQFKLEADVKRQLSVWKKEWIIKALALLSETEKLTKTTGNPAELLTARVLLMITNVASKARRGL